MNITIMEKEFVPYELALKLKELGFNKLCCATFVDEYTFGLQDFAQNYSTFPKHVVAAPFWQQAFDWFREEKDLLNHLTTHLNAWGEDGALETCYGYRIMIDKDGWKCEVWEKLSRYETYEEARKSCLEKLIEIVENSKK